MRLRRVIPVLLASLLTSAWGWAVPTLAIDLDALAPGVQSTRTVTLGDAVDVAVVLIGDGVTLFDTTIFDLIFNAGPPVLGLGPGGEAAAGALAATSALAFDVFGATPVVPGVPLTPKDALATGRLGGVGMGSAIGPFSLVGAGVDISIAAMTFETLGSGQTSLALEQLADEDFFLAFGGAGIDVDLANASLTVRGATTPEPGALLLLMAGLLVCARRPRQDS